MSVKIALAFSNEIFRESIGVLLGEDPDISVVAAVQGSAGPEGLAEAARSGAEVMIMDLPVLDRLDRTNPADHEGSPRLIVVDTGCDAATLARSVITAGVRGVLGCDATPGLLRKCIRTVAAGELWLDQDGMQTVIRSIREMGGRGNSGGEGLTDRERQVALLAGRGGSNREIASKLCISEQTVKSHLSSVYRKLDISSRSQLVTSAVRRRAGGGGLQARGA